MPKLTTLPDDGEPTSIRCSKRTKRELLAMGVCGETQEAVIKRLMFKKRTGKDTDDSEFDKKVKSVI